MPTAQQAVQKSEIQPVAIVTVTASGDSEHDSRSRCNNQSGIRSNYSSMWETAQRPVTVTQQQIKRYFEINEEMVVTFTTAKRPNSIIEPTINRRI